MAKRCEHCKFWKPTRLRGKSKQTGWEVWDGLCLAGVQRRNPHSLMLACPLFQGKGYLYQTHKPPTESVPDGNQP